MAKAGDPGWLRSIFLGGAAAAGPAGVAGAAASAASQGASGILGQIASALERPIYQDVRTTTTTRKNRDGTITTTTVTKGYSIPLGLPVLIAGSVMIWEVGLQISKAFGIKNGALASDLLSAAEFIQSPVLWVLNAEGQLIGQGIVSAGTALWDWLDGAGPTHNSPPAGAAKTIAMPSTGMAAISQLLQYTVGAGSSVLASKMPQLVNLIASFGTASGSSSSSDTSKTGTPWWNFMGGGQQQGQTHTPEHQHGPQA